MQKVYAIVAISTVVALGCTTAMAADYLAGPSSCTSCLGQSEVVAGECGCLEACDCGSASGCCESSCGSCTGCGCGICACYKAYISSFGYFNCSCRGSYKFPVPPQYTYHWPGMYSQRYMTEYTSPYRFPPLEIPEPAPREKGKVTVKPVVRSTPSALKAINPANPVPLPTQLSARPKPMSVRIKQKYGLK